MSIFVKAIEQLEEAKPPREVTFRYVVEVGRGLRDSYRTAIKDRVFLMGLTIDIDEDRGWFSSSYRIAVSGMSDALVRFLRWLSEVERLNA
jgi:hypothetical protein